MKLTHLFMAALLLAPATLSAQRIWVGGIMSAGFTPLQIELTAPGRGFAAYRPLVGTAFTLQRAVISADSFHFEWDDGDGLATAAGRVSGNTLRGQFVQGTFTGPIELIAGAHTDSTLAHTVSGLYRRSDGQLLWVGAISEFGRHLGYVNLSTGRVGALYHIGNRKFVAGATSFATTPTAVELSFAGNSAVLREGTRSRTLTRSQTYRTEPVRFQNGDAVISGTLVLPQRGGRHPAMVLMHGAGPARRSYFSALPYMLADAGVAVLVYDKRGVGASTGDRHAATMADFADDARSGARMLAQRTDIDAAQIGVFGHSQGGWQAPLAAARGREFSFVVMAAGPAKDYGEQTNDEIRMSMQAAGFPGAVDSALDHQRLYWRVVKRAAPWPELQRSVQIVSQRPWARFVWKPKTEAELVGEARDLIDPDTIIPRLRVPVLALYGDQDFRVLTSENAPLMRTLLARSAHPDATVMVIPNADHDFFVAREPTIRDVAHTTGFADGYLSTLRSWILRRVRIP